MLSALATIVTVYAVARLLLSAIQFDPRPDDPHARRVLASAVIAAVAIVLILVAWKKIQDIEWRGPGHKSTRRGSAASLAQLIRERQRRPEAVPREVLHGRSPRPR